MRALIAAALAVLSTLAYAPPLAAEASYGPTPEYEETVGRAFAEFELQNYAEARSVFLAAHRIYPNARTLRALGMVEYELKNYARSVEYLEQALLSEERPLTAAQRDEVETLQLHARGFVGRYKLVLQPTRAAVSLDGESLPEGPKRNNLALPVGEHVLTAQADGHGSFRRELHVVGGEHETIEVTLRALSDQAGEPSVDTPVYKKWWLWTGIGLIVAGGVAAAIIATRPGDPQAPRGGTVNETIHLLRWAR